MKCFLLIVFTVVAFSTAARIRRSCPAPPVPINGTVRCEGEGNEPFEENPDEYAVGATCQYECLEGFIKVFGPNQTTCGEGYEDGKRVYRFCPAPPCCARKCENPIDLAFVIDSSSSILQRNWPEILKFVVSIVEDLTLEGNPRSEVAYVLYNNVTKNPLQFGDYKKKEDLINTIRTLPYEGEGTNTGNALHYARTVLFKKGEDNSGSYRPGVPDVMLLITDGKADDAARTFEEARLIGKAGITFYTVGIAPRQDRLVQWTRVEEPIIRDIALRAGGGEDSYIPIKSGFSSLSQLGLSAQLCNPNACKGETENPTPPPHINDACPGPETPQFAYTRCESNPVYRDPLRYSLGTVCNYVCYAGAVRVKGPDSVTCASDSEGDQTLYGFETESACCAYPCNRPLDVAFVVDASSATNSDWDQIKKLITGIIDKLVFRSDAYSEIAVIRYNSEINQDLSFKDQRSKKKGAIKFSINKLTNLGGSSTSIKDAILKARTDVFGSNDNRRAPDILILIATGTPDNGGAVLNQAQKLKNDGIKTIVVGVPPDSEGFSIWYSTSGDLLERIAEKAGGTYIQIGGSYGDFSEKDLPARITTTFCNPDACKEHGGEPAY